MLEVLLRLLPVLLRHLVAYGDLLSDEAADAVRAARRQLLGLAIVVAAGGVAALMGCLWIVAAAWDGPQRLNAIGALCVGFALLALAGVWYANTSMPRGRPRPFQRLNAEWHEDLHQLASLYPSLASVEHAPPARELDGQ